MERAEERPRRPWLLGLVLALITIGVVVALVTSETSGTGAENVGDSGDEALVAPPPDDGPPPAAAGGDGAGEAERPVRHCEATESNPGGDNNYISEPPPERAALGDGFVIEGFVRSAAGCRALEEVPVRVWLATETGGETDNRATVVTDADGRFSIETDPTIPQFGEPNIHVAYDGDAYRDVFIRRVVDLDDERAVVNLTLREDG